LPLKGFCISEKQPDDCMMNGKEPVIGHNQGKKKTADMQLYIFQIRIPSYAFLAALPVEPQLGHA
jgi:hypothetical protein